MDAESGYGIIKNAENRVVWLGFGQVGKGKAREMGPMGTANWTSDTSMTHVGSNARKVEGMRALSCEHSFTGMILIAIIFVTQRFKTNSAQDRRSRMSVAVGV
uniref:Uncharacterized protein n=1 Tax=Noccaea caerulescens TaxID=107243 RepID=A0A1J3I868_NOCCA